MDIAVIKGITENVQLFLRDEFQQDSVAMFLTCTKKHICLIIPLRLFLNRNLIKNKNLVFDFAAIHVGTNTDRQYPDNTRDHCYPYLNQTITIIMCLIQITADYPFF